MKVIENVSLADFSTMRLGGKTRFFTTLESKEDIEAATTWADENKLPLLVIGGGSNIIFSDEEFDGLVAHNTLKGFDVVEDTTKSVTIEVATGEIWDDTVAKTVDMQLYGLECLSLIPGTVGATPVQNVGAYGQEIADVFVSLDAYDRRQKQWVTLQHQDCQFSYRKSIFNSSQKGRYIISHVRFQLQRRSSDRPLYAALQNYLDQHAITARDPHTIRQAVIAIRQAKLPDPQEVANSGSFFHNAIVPAEKVQTLLVSYPEMPHFPAAQGMEKIPSAWLIDQAGLKGKRFHGMYISDKQPLVLINESADSTADLIAIRDEIITQVNNKFGILLQQEPEFITPDAR